MPILGLVITLALFSSLAGEPMASAGSDQPEGLTLPGASGALTMYMPIVGRAGTWRPFSDDSPWNRTILAQPAVDPNSTQMIAHLMQSSSPVFWVNIYTYTVPIWTADGSTPEYAVTCTEGNCSPDLDRVPIPDQAVPDPGSDAHMLIVDLNRHMSWDMWWAHKQSDGSWKAGFGTAFDLLGDGVKPFGLGSARGSGFPLAAGLVYLEEVKAGHIRHALVMAYDWPRGCLVYPASTNCGLSSDPDAIPIGAHLQLDPSLDLDTLGLHPAARVIARAMQEYGLYVGDNGHGLSLYAESFYGKSLDPWAGLLGEDDLIRIPVHRLRVLKLGTLRCEPS